MAVSDLRFPDVGYLRRAVKACGMTNAVFAEDERGHYIASYEAPDWFNNLPQKTTEPAVDAKSRAPGVANRAAPGMGVCAAIRAWAAENPNATREDAFERFPTVNRSTVAIQFKKARA